MIADLVIDANLLIAGSIAFAAGIVSFASPCIVPLIPGYLSYLTGLSGADRSTALKVLEDLGFEAVDNLPLSLLASITRPAQSEAGSDGARPLAIGVDIGSLDAI